MADPQPPKPDPDDLWPSCDEQPRASPSDPSATATFRPCSPTSTTRTTMRTRAL